MLLLSGRGLFEISRLFETGPFKATRLERITEMAFRWFGFVSISRIIIVFFVQTIGVRLQKIYKLVDMTAPRTWLDECCQAEMHLCFFVNMTQRNSLFLEARSRHQLGQAAGSSVSATETHLGEQPSAEMSNGVS